MDASLFSAYQSTATLSPAGMRRFLMMGICETTVGISREVVTCRLSPYLPVMVVVMVAVPGFTGVMIPSGLISATLVLWASE